MSTAAPSNAMPGDALDATQYRRLVVVLGILGALGPMTIDTYLPALPRLAQNLDATASQAQLTLSAMMMGLGLGQLVFGPLSDAVGRRRPLLWGLIGHAVASVICGLAPTITVLLAGRLLQGLASASIAVASQAMIRDLFRGMRAAELLSRLALITGMAPILAPLVGSGLLTFTSWRGVFAVLATAAVLIGFLVRGHLAETLPPPRRIPATVGGTAAAYRRVLSDRLFLAVVLVAAMVFTALFAYVSGSSFVMQGVFRLSPQVFGVVFASMSLGLSLSSQFNPRLVRRIGPVRGLLTGLLVITIGALAMLLLAQFRVGGLAGFLVPMLVVMMGLGLALPNAPAVALHRHGANAGTAAALLGAAQFAMGGIVTPVVGALDDGTSRPIPLVILSAALVALVVMLASQKQLRAESYD
ncbi:DHA1 family bicyclomycin/chloramphenicol resistance-like MFS transporter [Luteococcus japonicus]|uniref:DHA1 family bicyclomycin/chloramphenicol resistance-like MFS transporter n=1 Tax=Luteococcus japonicus TaxID=33984 RepID=A0A3N1ZXD6_9ACTN|nr:multidrug effflux MFS transporter [Luteococcus japonicus]ROR55511.1 DHA1 family bicyclomycin/chloramphenicol resistance-like MFS transporter [Luteococcus japonicus]